MRKTNTFMFSNQPNTWRSLCGKPIDESISLCMFCSREPATHATRVVVDSRIDSLPADSWVLPCKQITENYVPVPRCSRCKISHVATKIFAFLLIATPPIVAMALFNVVDDDGVAYAVPLCAAFVLHGVVEVGIGYLIPGTLSRRQMRNRLCKQLDR
jgi:hypothetical protein